MIRLTAGNLLDYATDCEAIINTVNTVGVMGKGIALQFKKAYPKNYDAYRAACKRGEVKPGQMFVFETGFAFNPRFIINFPTKGHWKSRSKLEDVQTGLEDLIRVIAARGITSIAVPPLGCGLGGLDWRVVRPMIEAAFAQVPEVETHVFEPKGAPDPTTMPNRTKRPNMTPTIAKVLGLIRSYFQAELDYSCSLLEVHKLAYFLDQAGDTALKLSYHKDRYGPYSDPLKQVLNRMDGHFIQGLGDGRTNPDAPITLLDEAVDAARDTLRGDPGNTQRMRRVQNLIDSFQTPFGMELLATVHWVAIHEGASTADEVIARVHAWEHGSDWPVRKQHLFKDQHIRIAWDRLVDQEWIAA
ncbi:MAG: macro domain-containing protein [Planctomycetota bacterium]|jgi:O-acetyl-ADP-ribose deacetylase (regulator of RNase III)|nr:macro domain-containing protein [Planctomycetota bacterium]